MKMVDKVLVGVMVASFGGAIYIQGMRKGFEQGYEQGKSIGHLEFLEKLLRRQQD